MCNLVSSGSRSIFGNAALRAGPGGSHSAAILHVGGSRSDFPFRPNPSFRIHVNCLFDAACIAEFNANIQATDGPETWRGVDARHFVGFEFLPDLDRDFEVRISKSAWNSCQGIRQSNRRLQCLRRASQNAGHHQLWRPSTPCPGFRLLGWFWERG